MPSFTSVVDWQGIGNRIQNMATCKLGTNVGGLLKRVCNNSNGLSRSLRRCAWTSVSTGKFSHTVGPIRSHDTLLSTTHRCNVNSGKRNFSYRDVDYVLNVKTGDQLHAGTDANIYIILHSESGEKSEPIKLDYLFRDDFERGQLDQFKLKSIAHLQDIHKIELYRDDKGVASDWYVDYIELESVASKKRFIFPAFRWIKPDRHYIIHHMDNCLPQMDPEPYYRTTELNQKREDYQCLMKVKGGPAQVSCFPC